MHKGTIERRIEKLIQCGLLPEDLDMMSEEQQIIYEDVLYSHNKELDIILRKHLNHANLETKQKVIHKRINEKKNTRKDKGIYINIKPEDIPINEYCPFFGTKLNYNMSKGRGSTFRDPTLFSIDRFDNSKGYVKGNVIIMSRLANTMKRDATISELKTFCKNVIVLYNKRYP